MQLFYDPDITAGIHQLREVEAQHAARVLRKRRGDRIDLVDGNGGWFSATITDIDKRGCTLDVTPVRQEEMRCPSRTLLLVAPTKNIDRFEWILEKVTEIGVDVIQPILTEHSERTRLRTDRLHRVIESAIKQSLRAWLPELRELVPFDQAIAAGKGSKYLGYLGTTAAPLLHKVHHTGSDATIAIGPEGGFSPAEADLAAAAGYTFVSLGPHRLRTETAAITAVHTIALAGW